MILKWSKDPNKQNKKNYRVLGCFTLILALFIVIVGFSRTVRLIFWLKRPAASFPLSLNWELDLGNSAYDFPVYQDGLVVMPSKTTLSSYWYAVDATSGEVVWSKMIWWQRLGLHKFLRCLTSNYVVVSDVWSWVNLNLQTGDVVWQEKKSATTAGCSEDTIFFSGSPRDTIHAYSLVNGQKQWTSTNPSKSFNALIYNPETEKIIARRNVGPEDYYIIESKTGQLLHSFANVGVSGPADFSSGRGTMYLIDRGQLFLGGTVLDASTGELIHKETRYRGARPPTVTEDTIYIANSGAGVTAIDRETFELKWQYQPEHKIKGIPLASISPLAILDDVGYVIFADATLRAVDLESGQELGYWQPGLYDLWRWPHCGVPPLPGCGLSVRAGLTTSEDTLFVSFGDGKLYAFGRRTAD